jgi:predicted GIY-YIG superfamily endonuclease
VQETWFVYIARCNDGSLYTGIALDIALRISAHNRGRGARYTRGRGPLAVCAQRRCGSKGAALRLEWAVKRLPRPEKETLLVGRRLAAFARRVAAESAAAR